MRPKLGKDKILNAAVSLFSQKGFHKTSVSDIAKEAGVSKGLTYNYFKSKEDLLLAIVNQGTEGMFEVADKMFSSSNYKKNLKDFIGTYFKTLKEKKNYLSFQLSLIFQPDLEKIVGASLHKRAELLLEKTEDLFKQSKVDNPNLIARRFISELDGIALHYLSVFKYYPLGIMQTNLYENYKDLGHE